jgi:glyoxylase-like metal-dependent hydrolase (beta-lactamase superfamily II)
MFVAGIPENRFFTNSYVVADETSGDAAIVDANGVPESVIELVRERGFSVRAILLTHADGDHLLGLERLREEFPVPVAVHPAERGVLTDGRHLRDPEEGSPELRAMLPTLRLAGVDDLAEGRAYRAGSLTFDVLHLPGHSPGCVALWSEDCIFAGDVLIAYGGAKTAFHNGSEEAQQASLDRVRKLPAATRLFPGHGPITTVGAWRAAFPG